MVHFVGTAYGTEVKVVGVAEDLEPLVYEDVVYEKVGKPIDGDAQPYEHEVGVRCIEPQCQTQDAGYGKDEKEVIVLLEE